MSADFGDQKCLLASEIVKNPSEVLQKIRGRYQTIYDQSLVGSKWDNFDKALKIMAEVGWRVIGITTLWNPSGIGTAQYIYGVLERPSET